MAQNANPDDAQTTTTVYASDADTSRYGRDSEPATYVLSDARDTLDEFRAGVEKGDYLAVVYQTPSNGGSLQRVMGHVVEVERYDDGRPSILRFVVEDGTGDGPTGDEDATAVLFLNEEDAYRFDDGRADVSSGGFRLEKFSWTPEQ